MKTKSSGKSWTVMVYMAGDNNLDPEGVADLKEMKKVGSTDKVNVVAQFDRAKGHVARRYCLTKGGIVTGDAVMSLDAVNTGDPKALTDFIRWGIKNYPASHYLLVLWNHGNGWDDTDIYANERGLRRSAPGNVRHALFRTSLQRFGKMAGKGKTRGILYDDDAKDFLDNGEMTGVLADAAKLLGRKLDLLGLDACLMSMAEVGYEISGSVAYAVGSEQTEPGAGWPYQDILGALAARPDMTPQDLATLIVDKYLASYTPGDHVTYAASDLSRAGALAGAVAALAKVLKAGLADSATLQAIQTARNKAQHYEVTDNIDLVDFCELLVKGGAAATVAAACRKVVEVVQTGYVMRQGFKGATVAHSNGLAIYFPTEKVSPLYPGLAFSKKTGWDGFLNRYLAALRSR
jgi:hypothetical protein